MRSILSTFLLTLLSVTLVFAQDKVKERDVKGEWKMVIDIDYNEIEEEMEEDSWFGWAMAGAVSGLVENVLEEIDITMKFMDDGKYKMTVIAFDEEEIEYGEWYINREGELVIIDEDEEHEDDEVWLRDGKDLVSYQKTSSGRLKRQEVYLKKL